MTKVTVKKNKDVTVKTEERKKAEIELSPGLLNASTVRTYMAAFGNDVDVIEAFAVLKEKSKRINDGDLSDLEETLAAQVVSLNTIYAALAQRADQCKFLDQMEVTMKLALRAQAQCARTVEALASLKTPATVFAKQANIAHGHQQVNNAPSLARKTINSPNELLQEDNHGMDTRAPTKTRRNDTKMETVGKIHGTQDGRR